VLGIVLLLVLLAAVPAQRVTNAALGNAWAPGGTRTRAGAGSNAVVSAAPHSHQARLHLLHFSRSSLCSWQ
jgi:hypothetical protein